jgi:N-acetylglucosaminyldiphosphoundecaprenol N-acetyl-beta-D-mannosaminyltransferase
MLKSLPTFDKIEIVDIEFDFLLQDEVIHVIDTWHRAGRRDYVVLTNPHSAMMCRRDGQMREATTTAGLTLPDGVGVVLGAKLLGHGRRHRVTGPALMLALCDQGQARGYRHFFYGGAEGVAQKLVSRLTEQFPELQVAGTYCPPFREISEEEDRQVIGQINRTQPDIVWVGLGAPKQEKWIADHVGQINATALVGVGAAFDFHSGNVNWAPRWVRKCGMEWAYRLSQEPRRMWRRNLDSPLFLSHVLLQSAAERMRSVATRIIRPASPVESPRVEPAGVGLSPDQAEQLLASGAIETMGAGKPRQLIRRPARAHDREVSVPA